MRKIVIASDSFKGSLTSLEVAEAALRGVEIWAADNGCEDVSVVCVNVADGGEGTVEAVVSAVGGEIVCAEVSDPLGRPIIARYGLAGETAVIEMAAASGLPLLSADERNPELTSTRGTGEIIADAISRGARKFLIGIGGSATNDAGTGMLEALGFRFLDASGAVLRGCGKSLSEVSTIDDSGVLPELASCSFTVACDVDTQFCGPTGAAYIFAPQKGADQEMVARLDAGLQHFAGVVERTCGRSSSGAVGGSGSWLSSGALCFREVPGTGAAGGLGGAFLAFLGGQLVRGVDMVLDAISFNSLISGADLVITGEGAMDSQTPLGKTPAGVLSRCKPMGIPVAAICGGLHDCPALRAMGFCSITQVTPPDMPLSEALTPSLASANITHAVDNLLTEIF